MIGLTVFTMLALFGGVFMVFALAKFHGELKRLKRTRQLPDLNTWHVLTPFARGTASLAEPANNLGVCPRIGRDDRDAKLWPHSVGANRSIGGHRIHREPTDPSSFCAPFRAKRSVELS